MFYWILIAIAIGFLMYRYIGILLYQRKNFSFGCDTGHISYSNVPSPWSFLIDKYITKGKANLIRIRALEWQTVRRYKRFIFRAYKEIYLCPWPKLKELYVICLFELEFYKGMKKSGNVVE